MKSENKNQQAFPLFLPATHKNDEEVKEGLSKREWFAGMAMQGICANQSSTDNNADTTHSWIAEKAIKIADEILKQLEQ